MISDDSSKKIRAAVAKEVGVGNPAEETTATRDQIDLLEPQLLASSFGLFKRNSKNLQLPFGEGGWAPRLRIDALLPIANSKIKIQAKSKIKASRGQSGLKLKDMAICRCRMDRLAAHTIPTCGLAG